MRFVFFRKVVLAFFWGAFVAGCATEGTGPQGQAAKTPQTPEQAVTTRAQERWDALRAGQYDKAYAYITPSMRETLSLEIFRGRISSLSWIDVKVTKAVCEPEACDVSVKIDYYVLPKLRDSQTVNEKWILDRGNWWFVYRG